MANLSANEYISRGFDAIRPVLAAYICRELQKKDKTSWWSVFVYEKISDVFQYHLPEQGTKEECEKSLNILACFKIIEINWFDIFKYTLSASQRTYARELTDYRHKAARQNDTAINDEDAYRALDTMARFMEPVDQECAEQTRKLMREIREKIDNTEKTRMVTVQINKKPLSAITYAAPWRQIAEPHPDVAQGRFRQAEFAADLSQVLSGNAVMEYQDPIEFFNRTYITEGMKGMLIKAIQRVSGKGGEPVIQLKTAFGGGKTHSMLALYHLMNSVKPENLRGISDIFKEAGITGMPKVKVAALVGTALDPTKSRRPTKLPGITINTLWGEMTAQLAEQSGNPKLYDLIKEADKKAISPGSDTINKIFEDCSPCIILIDELVAYARKLYGCSYGDVPAGTFGNVLSFVQELTEAASKSKNSIVVASIPESEKETGGEAGKIALESIEHTFGRKEAIWKPVVAEEGFEIVRRRLFKDIIDQDAVNKTCNAFFSIYQSNPAIFPVECKEADYLEKMKRCYPIHPEVFDRLYNDWAAIDDFQKTRGVLRLMAALIYHLYSNNDGSAMIMSGSIAVGVASIRDELTRYLSSGWNSIIESEIDGKESKPVRLDSSQGGYYARQLAFNRVARTIFFGSASTIGAQKNKGIEVQRIRLGVLQPEENIPAYDVAMTTLGEQLTFLYRSGNRYWFDTRPTLKKTVADRAQMQSEDNLYAEIEKSLKNVCQNVDYFDAVHIAPSSSQDIPDTQSIRLIVLRQNDTHKTGDMQSSAMKIIKNIFETRGNTPRLYRNMVCFLASDAELMSQLKRETRTLLAWKSVEHDSEILNLDSGQRKEVTEAIQTASNNIRDRIQDAYCYLIVPSQEGTEDIIWKESKNTGNSNPVQKSFQRLKQDECLVDVLSPKILLMEMRQFNLWKGKDALSIRELWEDYTRYVYLHRLKNQQVLHSALQSGIISGDFFGYAEDSGETGIYRGLVLGDRGFLNISPDGYLVDLAVAKTQVEKQNEDASKGDREKKRGNGPFDIESQTPAYPAQPLKKPPTHFYGTVAIDHNKLGSSAGTINEEILQHLSAFPGAKITVTMDIQVDIPDGIDDHVARTVKENCKTLHFAESNFE